MAAAAMGGTYAGALRSLRCAREVALERRGEAVLVWRRGAILACLPAVAHAVVPGADGESPTARILDVHGVAALEIPDATPEILAALRALFHAAGPRVRVARPLPEEAAFELPAASEAWRRQGC